MLICGQVHTVLIAQNPRNFLALIKADKCFQNLKLLKNGNILYYQRDQSMATSHNKLILTFLLSC